MLRFLCFIGLLASISTISASYSGPFILFGRDELSHVKVNSLSELNEKFLHDIYSDSTAIILFVRNASSPLKADTFPIFRDLLARTSFVYLTQEHLGLDPMEFNLNAEVINLVGPTSQQDVELSALYRDAVITYGEGKVLGILASKNDHEIRKRAAADEITPESPTEATPSETVQDNNSEYVFYSADKTKILLFTSSAPVLFDGKNEMVLFNNVSTTITADRSNQNQRKLQVRYNYKEKLTIEYVFNVSGESWTLVQVDITWPTQTRVSTLYLSEDQPAAPLSFSYKCSRSLIFRNGSEYLKLSNIQVQLDVASKRFSDSYDCIGFTSAAIWSGIFISFIICFTAALALNCIMEIKAPSRFENSRGKQLTFTIQE